MANEAALNMQYFNENINGSKNINTEYKQTLEKEDNIRLGECYLNYLFSNDYMKPFIRKNYEIKTDKKQSYFDKLNIFNYKGIFNDVLNKKRKNIITSENESIKRILNILDSNYETSLSHNKNKNKHLNVFNTNYNSYIGKVNKNNLTINNYNSKFNSSYDQYMLPKININKNETNINGKTKQYSLDLINDIFRTTSCIRTQSNNNKKERNNKIISFYSPLLKKNLCHIFKKLENGENQTIKKSRIIKDGIRKITKDKFNIDNYDSEKNKYNIKYIKKANKKFCVINLFPDIGKVKNTQEIEKTLFNKNEVLAITKLRTNIEKRGIRRIYKNLKLLDS